MHVPLVEIEDVRIDLERTRRAIGQRNCTHERHAHEIDGCIDTRDLSSHAEERAVDHAQQTRCECRITVDHRSHSNHTGIGIGQHLFECLHRHRRSRNGFESTDGCQHLRIADHRTQRAAPLDQHRQHVRVTRLVQKAMHAALETQRHAAFCEFRQRDAHGGRPPLLDHLEERHTVRRRLAELRDEDVGWRCFHRDECLRRVRREHDIPFRTNRTKRASMR